MKGPRPHRYASKLACEALRAGMKGIDGKLIEICKPSVLESRKTSGKQISANLFQKQPALAYA